MLFHSEVTARPWAGPASYAVIAYSGALLNIVLIVSVVKDKTMRSSPTYIVLMNLAVADVFTLLVAPSALVYTHFVDGQMSDDSCRFTVFVFRVTMALSGYSVAAFSFLRYLLVVHPFFAKRHVTATRVKLICVLMWPLFIAENSFSFSAVIFGKFYTPTCYFVTCVFTKDYDLVLGILVLPDFLLPFLLISGFHVAKLAQFRNHVTQSETHGTQKTVSTRAVMAIIVAFLICYLPYNVMLITNYLLRTELTETTYPILIVLSSLSLINSIFNPIVYFFLSRRNVLSCQKCRK